MRRVFHRFAWWHWVLGLLLGGVIIYGGLAVLAAFSDEDVEVGSGETAADAQPPKTVVILSIPHVEWEDMLEHDLPTFQAFFRQAMMANLATRTARRTTTLERAYATLSAGNRANAGRLGAAAFNKSELIDSSSARQAYARRVGEDRDAAIYHVGVAPVLRYNEDDDFGALPGVLGTALVDNGILPAVIGNADGPPLSPQTRDENANQSLAELALEDADEEGTPPLDVRLGRSVAMMGMTKEGVVPLGTVADGLLKRDVSRPYSVGLDNEEVLHAFHEVLVQGAGLVVVEASDLVRAERAKVLALEEQHEAIRAAALHSADRLLAGMLERLSLEDATYFVLSPVPSGAPRKATEQLTLFAMAGPGITRGAASSPSTRRSGIVTLPDVAPSILHIFGVDRPDDMTGRRVANNPTDKDVDDLISSFVVSNDQAITRDRMTPPSFVALVVTHGLVYLGATLYLWRRRMSESFAFLAISMMYLPVAMFLVRFFPIHRLGSGWSVFLIWALSVLFGAFTFPLRRWWKLAPPFVVALVTFLVLGIDVCTGSWLELNSPLGYSAIVAARFVGFGNLGFALFYCSAILLAVCIVHNYGVTTRVKTGLAIFFVLVVVLNGAPGLGADVGGVLSGAPSLLLTWLFLTGQRIRLRSLVLAAAVGVLFVGVFAALDLARPEESRTHLGRFVESVAGGGWETFATVLDRKLAANLRILRSSPFVNLLPVSVIFLVVMTFQRRGLWSVVLDYPGLADGLSGMAIMGVTGMAVNDSGVAIPTMMIAIIVPLLLYLRALNGEGPATANENKKVGDRTRSFRTGVPAFARLSPVRAKSQDGEGDANKERGFVSSEATIGPAFF